MKRSLLGASPRSEQPNDYAFTLERTVGIPPESGGSNGDRLRRCPISIRLYPSNDLGVANRPPDPTWIRIESVTLTAAELVSGTDGSDKR